MGFLSNTLGFGWKGFRFHIRASRDRTGFTLLPFLVEGLHVVHPHTEDEEVSLPGFLGHLHVGPVHGADGEGAVQHELMLPVPEASVPAVEICSDRSAAGMTEG